MKFKIDINPDVASHKMRALASAVAQYGMPDSCEIIQCGRNTVALFECENLVIKAFGVPGLIKAFIYRWLRKPKSARAFANALRLRQLGISTPEPAFAVERYTRCGLLAKSYYACEYHGGWHELRGVEKRPDFPAFARALAAFIADIHDKKVFMKDMTPGNILFVEKDGGYDFTLVDINRMDFGKCGRREIMLNFRALLDTAEGTVAVAGEYARLLQDRGMEPPVPDFVDAVQRKYRKFYNSAMRRRRLKKLLHL